MGVVLRQGFKNTIFTYLGFLIGGIYTVLLIPKVFSANPEHWGTARYLMSYAMIIVPWAQLSIPNVIIRYFPIFRKDKFEEFIFFVLSIVSIGVIISTLIVIIFSSHWFDNSTNPLIFDNRLLVLPLFIGFVMFEVSMALAKSLFKSTIPVFLKEFLLRFGILFLILLYWYKIIDFKNFILIYSFSYLIITSILLGYIIRLKKIKIKIDFSVFTDAKFRPLYTFAVFNILSTSAAMILLNIDTLMINHFLTLKDVAIYGPSIYIASSIVIPSRALHSIVSPVIANNWANNSIDDIKNLYKKTAIAPLVITIFIFLMIWINIDLVMDYFGKTFGKGKYIVLFLSMGHIINIATGINGTIINTSKHYKADLFFQIGLIIVTVIMNIIFIPLYGLNGAALATAITLASYNFMKSIFVHYKFKMHPFSRKTLYALAVGTIFFFIIQILPKFSTLLVRSIVYTIITFILYWTVVYYLNISKDINMQIKKVFKILAKG